MRDWLEPLAGGIVLAITLLDVSLEALAPAPRFRMEDVDRAGAHGLPRAAEG